MIILCREQLTQQWFDLRKGRVSASSIAKAMRKLERASGDKKKGDWHSDHDNYVRELAWEIVTGQATEHWVSEAMDNGRYYEKFARIEYMMQTGNDVEQTGLIQHPRLSYFVASPDGLVEGRKTLEIKVPLLKTHEKYILEDVVPEEYQPQMQAQMCCAEYDEGDFVSFAPPELYPDFPEEFRLFVKPLVADPAMHREMEEAATATMEEAVALATKLRERFPAKYDVREEVGAGADLDMTMEP